MPEYKSFVVMLTLMFLLSTCSWGEDGYIRVAQASYGRRWGLFGMLSQGVVAIDVQNVTGQVYDEPQGGSSLTGWQIALIAVAGFLVAALCCCCIMTATKKK